MLHVHGSSLLYSMCISLETVGHLGTVKGYRVAVRIEVRIAFVAVFFVVYVCLPDNMPKVI